LLVLEPHMYSNDERVARQYCFEPPSEFPLTVAQCISCHTDKNKIQVDD
jgi:hypothetical protein